MERGLGVDRACDEQFASQGLRKAGGEPRQSRVCSSGKENLSWGPIEEQQLVLNCLQ